VPLRELKTGAIEKPVMSLIAHGCWQTVQRSVRMSVMRTDAHKISVAVCSESLTQTRCWVRSRAGMRTRKWARN
jgi:hypothetical protein